MYYGLKPRKFMDVNGEMVQPDRVFKVTAERYFVESPKVRLYGMKISAIIQIPTNYFTEADCGTVVSEFLDGKTTDYIKRIFEKEEFGTGMAVRNGSTTTLMSMLENEKYKGDTLLQKAIRWISLPSGRRTKGKSRCFMWKMTTMPSFQSGFGNVYSLK